MSEARQIGLMGELYFLQVILNNCGGKGIGAWTGPIGERHDFRMGAVEVEVKSTLSSSRKHVINGLAQLEASPGKSLYVLSIQFEVAGMGGWTLPGFVESVRRLLAAHAEERIHFNEYIRRLGYTDSEAPLYTQSYQLRSQPVFILVNNEFPKITTSEIETILKKNLVPRIGDIQYEVNLDGLGCLEGSSEYKKVLNNLSSLG